MAKLSIIIPVYGVEKYLAGCLDSIYPQLNEECEIILVDDGSPDGCPAICDNYKERYPERTTVIHQENRGLGGARNAGIKAARGEFLLFVDSDDTLTPDAIFTIFCALEEHNADITVFPFNVISEGGGLIEIVGDRFECNKPICPKNEAALITGTPNAVNKVVRATVFEETGVLFPNRVWYEDIRTMPKLVASADSIVYIEKPLYNYLRREGSIMNSVKLERNTEIIDALEDLVCWFKEKELYEAYSEALDYLIIDHVLVSAIVRIIRSAGTKHPLIKTFREYTEKNCPSYISGKNSYVKGSMPPNRRLVYKLLRKKLYFAVKLIFKIKK